MSLQLRTQSGAAPTRWNACPPANVRANDPRFVDALMSPSMVVSSPAGAMALQKVFAVLQKRAKVTPFSSCTGRSCHRSRFSRWRPA